MEKKKLDAIVVRYMLLAAAFVLGIQYFEEIMAAVGGVWGIIFPLVLGAVIAYILNINMRWVEKFYFPKSRSKWVQKTRRPVGILAALVTILAVFVLIIRLVLPELVNAFQVMGKNIPIFTEKVIDWLILNSAQFPSLSEELSGLEVDWNNLLKNAVTFLGAGVGGILNSTISVVGVLGGGVMNFVIALIFAIYILSSKERLFSQGQKVMRAYLKPALIGKLRILIKTIDETFSSFIVGQCTEAVILGVLCTLGMMIFQFPYAPMIGTFIGATALIPIVGAYLGATVGCFMILTVDPLKAVLFIVFIIVLQQLEGNLVYPKVVGSSIGLPGMWVLAAVTIGGGLGGIPGMLLGVPSAATIYKLLSMDVNLRCSAAGRGLFQEKKEEPSAPKQDKKTVSQPSGKKRRP